METLIMSVLGDIIGYKYKEYTKKNERRPLKQSFGNSFTDEGKYNALKQFFKFIGNGGTYAVYDNKYSFNSLILFATIKGLKNNNCNKEYVKIFDMFTEKKLYESLGINNKNYMALKNLKNNRESVFSTEDNDSMAIIRAIPYGLIYYKKDEQEKLIKEIIMNMKLTHYNNSTFLSAITLGIFITYSLNKVDIEKWGYKIVDYLSSNEFDVIIKEMKLYDEQFFTDKEDYLSMWKQYLNDNFNQKGNSSKYIVDGNKYAPAYKSTVYYYINENQSEFVYGLRADEAIMVAYDALLLSDKHWQTMVIVGVLGPTDNAVLGTICGALYGVQYKNDDLQINKYSDEEWIKKTIKLGKSLGI